MRSGAPQAREQVQWTCESDERAELKRGAGELPEASSQPPPRLSHSDIYMHAHPGRSSRLRLGRKGSRGGHLLERQGRETRGFFQGGGEIRLGRLLRRLRHLQPGPGLAGGLLGGDQGGADLHQANLAKQG